MPKDTGITPKTGYKSPQKQEYRERVWAALSPRVLPRTWAVIMPGRGCEEIEVALDFGVPMSQIFCFDASAAVIATSLWRKKYPEIKFAACTLSQLPQKIAKIGHYVSVINMDLCGNVAGDCVDEVDDFLMSGIMHKRSAFAVNLAKGREGRTLLKALAKLSSPDWIECDRIKALWAISRFGRDAEFSKAVYGLDQGTYREHKTPMTWAAFYSEGLIKMHHSKAFKAALRRHRDNFDPVKFNTLIKRGEDAMQNQAKEAINIECPFRGYSHFMGHDVTLSSEFNRAWIEVKNACQTVNHRL